MPKKDVIDVFFHANGRRTIPAEQELRSNQLLCYASPDYIVRDAFNRPIGTWYTWNRWFARGTAMESIYAFIAGTNYHGKKAEDNTVIVLTQYKRGD